MEGCCRFWDDISGDETCAVGGPYLELGGGGCENQGAFEGFTCVSCYPK